MILKPNKRFILTLGIIILSSTIQASEPEFKYVNPSGKQFPILAWSALPVTSDAHERFMEMAQAGFNLSLSGYSKEDMEYMLKAAEGTGVKLFIQADPDNPEQTVRQYGKNPNVAGFMLRDEPDVKGMKLWAEVAARIRKLDKGSHMLYMNLFPICCVPEQYGVQTYDEYVECYFKTLAPYLGYVSYDMYPVLRTGLRTEYYTNLERITTFAKKNGDVPFWAFSLSVPHQVTVNVSPYPYPTRASMRLQIFSDLAYGAQGIQYFTYVCPGKDPMNFHAGPLNEDRKLTDIYDNIAEINKEVIALTDVFLGAKMQKVIHLGEFLPNPYVRDEDFPEMTPSVVSGNDGKDLFLVSHLTNGNKHYLMIVNEDLYNPGKITVTRKPGVMRVMPDGRRVDASRYADTLQVEAGDMLLFEWE